MKFDNYILHNNFKRKRIIEGEFHEAEEATQPMENPTREIRSKMTDSEGLKRAYKKGDYFVHGDTMYIAGSRTMKDWFDDFTKIPAWGDLRNSTRYQEAHEGLMQNPQVKTVVGHSLGGSVALELEKNYKHLTKSRTYGAPVFDLLGKEENNVDRYRNWGDPFSVTDRSAKKSVKFNPFESLSITHDYGNIASNFASTRVSNESSRNADGSISLFG